MNNYKITYNVRLGIYNFHFDNVENAETFTRLAASGVCEEDKRGLIICNAANVNFIEEDNEDEE